MDTEICEICIDFISFKNAMCGFYQTKSEN